MPERSRCARFASTATSAAAPPSTITWFIDCSITFVLGKRILNSPVPLARLLIVSMGNQEKQRRNKPHSLWRLAHERYDFFARGHETKFPRRQPWPSPGLAENPSRGSARAEGTNRRLPQARPVALPFAGELDDFL